MSLQCGSCGIVLTTHSGKCRDGKSVPSGVPCCWDCWSQISPEGRVKITIAVRDREVGGVLAEMAAALDRLDDRDNWKDA